MGLLLAVLSGIAWSGVDAFRKSLAARRGPIPIVVMLSVGQLPIFLAWFALTGPGDGELSAYLPWGLGSALINLGASLAFVRAVQVSSLSRTIPFLSFTPVFTTAIAFAVLGERPGPVALAGIGVVVLGAAVMSFARAEGLRLEPGSLLMIGVSIGWATTAPVDKNALAQASVPAHALFQSAVILTALVTALAVRGRLSEARPDGATAKPLLGAVLCMAAASGLQYVAFTLTMVALVETIKRALGGVMAVVLGRLVFSERVARLELLAVGLMSGGAALIVVQSR